MVENKAFWIGIHAKGQETEYYLFLSFIVTENWWKLAKRTPKTAKMLGGGRKHSSQLSYTYKIGGMTKKFPRLQTQSKTRTFLQKPYDNR